MTCGTPKYDEYFHFLCQKIGIGEPGFEYFELARVLFSIPFRAFIPNDENREMDGLDLRFTYFEDYELIPDEACSMLEMLVALAFRMEYEIGFSSPEVGARRWFFEMIGNVVHTNCVDSKFDFSCEKQVREAFERVNSRSYEADGTGGLFPLIYPPGDCREIELAFQMSQYMYERYYTIEG